MCPVPVVANKHLTELDRLRGDPQCQTQDVWVGSAQTQESGEAHRDVVGACLIKPEDTSPADGAAATDQLLRTYLEDAALSGRGPCRAGKTLPQSPADKRRQHLSEAPERLRHVTAPSRAGILGRLPRSLAA